MERLITVYRSSLTYKAVVEILLRLLPDVGKYYPLLNVSEEHVQELCRLALELNSVRIDIRVDAVGSIRSFAIITLDDDVHVGKCVSIMCNYSLDVDVEFQRYVHTQAKRMAKREGLQYVAYTRMNKDGMGCNTRYRKVL